MSESARIVDQLERAFRGDAWHGPSLGEVLADVDADTAGAHPIPGAHSIRELVAHVIAWEKECLARIAGAGSKLPPERDWPEDGAGWNEMVSELEAVQGELSNAVAALSEHDLDRPVRVGMTGTTVYILVHGIVQHNLYHAGQIALLRKAGSARA